MSTQCKQVSSSVIEICEESNNLTSEDFIWVDLPDADRGGAICESSVSEITIEVQIALNSSAKNIVQSTTESVRSQEESPNKDDQSDCDSDLFVEDTEDSDLLLEEILESNYDLCIKHKPLQSNKLKYPNPYIMKIRERGIYSIEKREKEKEKKRKERKPYTEQKSNLLPKMKLDASTTQVLEMLINSRYLGQCNELVYNGKNSMVFHAHCSWKHDWICTPIYIAVKIYKISNVEKKNKIIYKQVQREFEHLEILQKTWKMILKSPSPIRARQNVILTGFMGCDQWPFVTIDKCSSEHNQAIYDEIVEYMDKCYNIANLIHGKLSVKKILCHISDKSKQIIRVLGWSHSVKRNHPMALPKLMKDCHFVSEFYKNRGVVVKSTLYLFKQITNQDTVDPKLLKIINGKNLYEKYNTNPNRRNTSFSKPFTTNKRFKW